MIVSQSKSLRDHFLGSIEYLVETALLSSFNVKYSFSQRFDEIYNEILIFGEDPTLQKLTEMIHDENISILHGFYQQYDYSDTDMSNVVDFYLDKMASKIEVDIENELTNKMGPAYTNYFDRNHKAYHLCEAQNILVPSML